MPANMFGANTDELREVGRDFSSCGRRISLASQRCANEVRAVAWEGPDRDRYVLDFEQRVGSSCKALAEVLSELGSIELTRQADEQDRASDAQTGALMDASSSENVAQAPGADELKADEVRIADKGQHLSRESRIPTSPSDIDTLDLNQGTIGDCWMLAAVGAVADTPGGQELLSKHIRYDADNNQYVVTLYDEGVPVEVYVDNSYVTSSYLDEKGKVRPFVGALGDDGKPNYASIYEKALAEYYGDTYGEVWGGPPRDALEAITGNEAERARTSNGLRFWEPKADSEYIRDKIKEGEAVVLASKSVDDMPPESKVVYNHAYIVQDVLPDGSLVVYNPWGNGGYTTEGYDAGQMVIPADQIDDYFAYADSVKV